MADDSDCVDQEKEESLELTWIDSSQLCPMRIDERPYPHHSSPGGSNELCEMAAVHAGRKGCVGVFSCLPLPGKWVVTSSPESIHHSMPIEILLFGSVVFSRAFLCMTACACHRGFLFLASTGSLQ